ncbi:type IV pilus biogenesis/stability protein PilW [Ramlibacter sp. MMS24-I3-19]|uniref:type IV pilus biogenesis/stability protein PilW n=1 Tax=Ramlibacter sp. MMS24-I3-19 TaxID=3416606 RepID=UPI003D073D3E
MVGKRGLGQLGLLVAALPWAALLAGAITVSGCATPQAESTQDSVVTEFDEPEARKRARIRMELAVGYFQQGKTNIALDELKQVIAIDPSYADAYNLRGLIYMQLNDPRLAEESFRRAMALSPRDANTMHNLGWLQCQQRQFEEADRTFEQALAIPLYPERAKTLMARGLCQARDGKPEVAERTLAKAYELDAGNPIVGYNLANLLFARGDTSRAQFYIRRLNNSELANAESLWLGIKVERKMGDKLAMAQLADQLKKRFPRSRETTSLEKGSFDE